jgi:hypothetical protein
MRRECVRMCLPPFIAVCMGEYREEGREDGCVLLRVFVFVASDVAF